MKFRTLKSVGHNIADSFATGLGLLVGYYTMDVFGEAALSEEGFITVNFLDGTISGGKSSSSLTKAVSLYAEELSGLCRKHNVSREDFSELSVKFSKSIHGEEFIVTVSDWHDHSSVDKYIGSPGRRVRVMDDLGRIRKK